MTYRPDVVTATADAGLPADMIVRLCRGQFTTDDLQHYWKTPHFARLCAAAIEDAGTCALCDRVEALTAHHKHYRSLFRERLRLDIVVLCRMHHRRAHHR